MDRDRHERLVAGAILSAAADRPPHRALPTPGHRASDERPRRGVKSFLSAIPADFAKIRRAAKRCRPSPSKSAIAGTDGTVRTRTVPTRDKKNDVQTIP